MITIVIIIFKYHYNLSFCPHYTIQHSTSILQLLVCIHHINLPFLIQRSFFLNELFFSSYSISIFYLLLFLFLFYPLFNSLLSSFPLSIPYSSFPLSFNNICNLYSIPISLSLSSLIPSPYISSLSISFSLIPLLSASFLSHIQPFPLPLCPSYPLNHHLSPHFPYQPGSLFNPLPSLLCFRNWRYEQELDSLLWKIEYKEIKMNEWTSNHAIVPNKISRVSGFV